MKRILLAIIVGLTFFFPLATAAAGVAAPAADGQYVRPAEEPFCC